MNDGFGMERPGEHSDAPLRKPARYLVIIESAGSAVACLFTDAREQSGEFDASSEEVALMTRGLVPAKSALSAEWDRALHGHGRAARAAAEVYTLDV